MFTALSVKLNVIHLGCEVFCLRELAEKSNGGEFFVPLDEKHFEKILDSISLPVPLTDPSCFKMIHLAFAKSIDDNIRFRICKLHVDNKCLCDRCYECPKCFANYCSIPIDCRICGLTLTSSIYIARSYQHLFPLQKLQQHEFEEQDAASPNIEQFCFMCQQQFDLNTAQHYFTKDGAFSGGPDVRKYCLDCNLFMVNSIGASF
ncbi:MAG: General transcription factor IIH subunit 2 [Marteilia pararefringens]